MKIPLDHHYTTIFLWFSYGFFSGPKSTGATSAVLSCADSMVSSLISHHPTGAKTHQGDRGGQGYCCNSNSKGVGFQMIIHQRYMRCVYPISLENVRKRLSWFSICWWVLMIIRDIFYIWYIDIHRWWSSSDHLFSYNSLSKKDQLFHGSRVEPKWSWSIPVYHLHKWWFSAG